MDLSRFPVLSDVMIQILLTLLAVRLPTYVAVTNRFTQLEECICAGYNLTFECAILGTGLTVWRGSAFDCASTTHQILLSHSHFEQGATGRCNNGAIVASSIDVVDLPASNGSSDQCFISQLNIAVTDAMRNKTVECLHDFNSQKSAIIGNTTLIFTTESYPPPDNIHLVSYSVNPNSLTFAWDSLLSNCSTLNYTIVTTNCGRCLPPASHTSAVCMDVPITGNPCIFIVRTDVCGRIAGVESEPLLVQFKVIEPPTPKIMPHFSCTYQTLTVDISFNKTDPFNIADGFDGSASSYTIIYAKSESDEICGTDTIQASACVGLTCTHTFKIRPPSLCLTSSSSVSIAVFVTNALGNGPASDPIVFIIPECDASSGTSGVAATASVFTVILLAVSGSTISLVIVTVLLLKRNARIKKELIKAKESSTYEEVDIPTFPTPASIGTTENISYHPVSRK